MRKTHAQPRKTWSLRDPDNEKGGTLAAFPYAWSKSEIVFDLTVLDLEFTILQVGVTDEHVLVAVDQLLGRQQAGAGIDYIQRHERVAHGDVVGYRRQ